MAGVPGEKGEGEGIGGGGPSPSAITYRRLVQCLDLHHKTGRIFFALAKG
jgi:hypothetical protein